MRAECYLIFVKNETTGCLRLTSTGNPRACVENMENLSGCPMRMEFCLGYPSVEESVERRDVLKDAFAAYSFKSTVDGLVRSQFTSWFSPDAWGHLDIGPDALEEAVEELYANYDGSTWKLEDSLPA